MPTTSSAGGLAGLRKIREANAGWVVERGDAAVPEFWVVTPCCRIGRLGFSAAVAEPLGRACRAWTVAQKRATCQRCGGRRCGQARVPINAGLLLFTSRRSPIERSARRRRPAPTLDAASRGGAESCAQGRAKCVQACTFVGREPPVRPKIRRRTVWICRSRRCGHHKVRHVTLGPVSGRALHHSAWPSLVTFPEQRCTIAGPRSWAALHALRLADYVVHSTGAVCYP